jgi:hypothetical protein
LELATGSRAHGWCISRIYAIPCRCADASAADATAAAARARRPEPVMYPWASETWQMPGSSSAPDAQAASGSSGHDTDWQSQSWGWQDAEQGGQASAWGQGKQNFTVGVQRDWIRVGKDHAAGPRTGKRGGGPALSNPEHMGGTPPVPQKHGRDAACVYVCACARVCVCVCASRPLRTQLPVDLRCQSGAQSGREHGGPPVPIPVPVPVPVLSTLSQDQCQ